MNPTENRSAGLRDKVETLDQIKNMKMRQQKKGNMRHQEKANLWTVGT